MCLFRFPSSFFYGGRLMDGIRAADRAAPFHRTSPLMAPLAVLDCAAGREQRGGGGGSGGGSGGGAGGAGSVSNREEAALAAGLYRGLVELHPEFGGTVAVLSP